MQSFVTPIVSAHFVPIGSPLDSFRVSSWDELAPCRPADPVRPSVASATARAVPESVLAWRARYYAFRAARSRILAGQASAARDVLAGPHGEYVRGRFAELARGDRRFALVDSVATVTAPQVPARVADASLTLPATVAPAAVAVDVVKLAAAELPAGVTFSRNDALNGLELRFVAKPGEGVRDVLKGAGWRWSHTSACWYRRAEVSALARLRPLCQSIAAAMVASPRARADVPEQSTSAPARADAPEQSSPIDSPATSEGVAAPIDAPTNATASGGAIIHCRAMMKALRALVSAIPAKVPGNRDVTTKRLRIWSVGDTVRVGALDFPAVPTVDVSPVQVDRPFAVGIVAGKVLLDIFALSNDDVMSLCVEGGEVHVRGADSHYKLFTAPIPAALPDLVAPVDDASHWMTTTAGELAESLRLVEFAASRSGTRYAFDCVCIDFIDGRCEVIATDGRRLMLANLAGKVREGAAGTVLIARGDVKALRRALANLAKLSPVHLCIGEPANGKARPVSVIGPALEWRGTSTDAAFPEWRELMPKQDSTSTRYQFDVEELAAILRRVSTMTSEDSKGVKMTFDVGGRGRVELVSRNPEQGQTVAHCQAIDAAGEPFAGSIGFNPALLGEALKTAKRGKVVLALVAPNRPGLLTFDNGARYLLMPVNLQ